MVNCAAFTIATGKRVYFDMAVALARSFRLWHRGEDIRFYLATEKNRSELPSDLAELDLIPLEQGQYGAGFASKLHLDLMAPADHSLFIDADCLCVGSLVPAFARFSGHAVSVIGREITDGEWFGDVAAICRRFDVPAIPRFNGGIYYLERGVACTRVYETARSLEPQYDNIGFLRLRGFPNDEVVVSLAMALCGQKPIAEAGDIMNSLLAAPGGVDIDVFKGRAVLRNPKDHSQHNSWYQLEQMRPRLVHFLGSDVNTYPYRQEMIRLNLVARHRWPVWLATWWAKLSFSVPWLIADRAKKLLRPLYHAIFGHRKIRVSARS